MMPAIDGNFSGRLRGLRLPNSLSEKAGTPQEVITQQALREIFDVEAEVITHPVLNVPVCLPFRITEQNKKTGGSNT